MGYLFMYLQIASDQALNAKCRGARVPLLSVYQVTLGCVHVAIAQHLECISTPET